MKEKYVTLESITVNLQNLRWVQKINTKLYGSNIEKYTIEFCYNSKHEPKVTASYETEKRRNADFTVIAGLLEKP